MDKVVEARPGVVYSSLLSGKHYTKPEFFEREKQRVFERSWIFAGTEASLMNDNDYLLLQLAGWSVIVGRYGGKIRAFENRCTHRSSTIYCHDSGNRPLRCPFHGWSFNEKGIPTHIPHNSELFQFSETDRLKLGLKVFETAQVGELIFVRMPDAKQSLKDFLGTMYEALRAFDSKWTAQSTPDHCEILCNWKLMIEVALEDYHTNEIHPVSLGVHGQPPAAVHHFAYTANGHQVMNIGNHPDPKKTNSAATVIFIFPNFFAVQLDGKISTALSICPLAPDKTNVRSFTFHERGAYVSHALMTSIAKSLYSTNLEDKRACENVQSQIHRHKRGQPLGAVEASIYQFQRSYSKKMSAFPALAGLFSRARN